MIKQIKHIYSDGIANKKIALLGSYPPPLGGISIHVRRVEQKFIRQGNQVQVFKTTVRNGFFSYLWSLIKFLYSFRPDRIYYHSFFLGGGAIEFPLILFCSLFLRSELILIDHVSRFFYGKRWWYKRYTSFLFRLVHQQILIGSSTYQSYLDNKMFLGKTVSVEEAFLLPNTSEEHQIINQYPNELSHFLNIHSPIIIANASKAARWQGKDLYGLDMCIDLVTELREDFPKVGLIIALSTVGDQQYFDVLQKRIEVEPSIFLLLRCQAELWPLFKKADVMVRPTMSDGASVSLAEAVHLGVPTVASNVCTRAPGTVLFEASNKQDFVRKVYKVLNS